MKSFLLILLFIILTNPFVWSQGSDRTLETGMYVDAASYQESVRPGDSIRTSNNIYVARAIVLDGDTLWIATIDEVYIFPTKKFKNSWQRRKYTRLIYNVQKAYPWAKLAGDELAEVEKKMLSLDTEKEQKEYIKQIEDELLGDYADDLKKLTITQGRILIKLVDRQTGDTSYELVRELRGKMSAVFWQTLARLFGSNLKSEYDPVDEDRLIEEIVLLIENGQL